jgi:hypothetical protein
MSYIKVEGMGYINNFDSLPRMNSIGGSFLGANGEWAQQSSGSLTLSSGSDVYITKADGTKISLFELVERVEHLEHILKNSEDFKI